MAASPAGRPSPSVDDEWVLPGIRPVTLLVASGIALISALIIISGLFAGRLRDEALANKEGELTRLSVILAAEGDRSFAAVDRLLASIADRTRSEGVGSERAFIGKMGAPEIHALLRDEVRAAAWPEALLLIGADGTVINASGDTAALGRNLAGRDYFRALRSGRGDVFFGSPAVQGSTAGMAANAWVIPVARKLVGSGGAFLGVIAAEIPIHGLKNFYRSVPLDAGGTISLLRRDGLVLAHFPEERGATGRLVAGAPLRDTRAGGSVTLREPGSRRGEWQIVSITAFRDYPLAVLVTGPAQQALIGWLHGAALLGAFVLIGAVLIAVMVLLIARQFRIHATLAAVRVEKIEMERARIAAEAELLKKDRLSVLGQLTATVAHELRNPLSAIRNTLFSIRELAGRSGLALDRPLARIERSIERCDRIISDLLEYTKTREIRRSALRFDAWLDEVLAEQNLAADTVLVRELHASGAIVPIDADRIRRVLINLIDNAVQAMTEPQAECQEKRITVRTQTAGRILVLTVEDTGPGIPPENLARVFEPLFSTKNFGTGLGLATVKQIVAQHGGTIDIASEPGHGARVVVRLPLEEEARVAA